MKHGLQTYAQAVGKPLWCIGALTFVGLMAQDAARDGNAGVLEAGTLLLRDPEGRVRCRIEATNSGALITCFDSEGREQLALGSLPAAPAVQDHHNGPEAYGMVLGSAGEEPGLFLYSVDGAVGMDMGNPLDTSRFEGLRLFHTAGKTGLEVVDSMRRIQLGMDPLVGLLIESPEAHLSMGSSHAFGAALEIRDASGGPAVFLFVDKENAQLELFKSRLEDAVLRILIKDNIGSVIARTEHGQETFPSPK